MSCNGCRVLRKGCSDECMLRQSLQWIHSPRAQGHATVFVAKFFGRAGLMSFISAVPQHQRPALFQSLLYEAVGRTVNPVNGAVGLLWTGNWQVCEKAVATVFRGGSLDPLPESLAGSDRHHKACSEFCYTAGKTEQQQQQQQRRRSSVVTAAAAAAATAAPRVAATKRALDHEVVTVGDQLQPVLAVPADDDQLDLCLMVSKPRAATPSEEEESGTTTLGSSSGGSTPADCTTSLEDIDGGRRRKLLRLFI